MSLCLWRGYFSGQDKGFFLKKRQQLTSNVWRLREIAFQTSYEAVVEMSRLKKEASYAWGYAKINYIYQPLTLFLSLDSRVYFTLFCTT